MHRLARPVRTGLGTFPLVLGARLVLGLMGGVCLWLAFPGHDVWWLAVVGCAGLALATAGATWWAGALSGLLLGLAWFTPMFTWAGTYAGGPAWLAMSVVSALYPAALGALLALLQRAGNIRPLLGAAAWVLMEWARSVTPFGGFPWARLGFSQADSPMLGAVSLVGVPGLGLLIALIGGLLAVALQRFLAPGGRQVGRAAAALVGAVVLVAAPLLVPRPTAGENVTVAAVQGDLPEGFSRTLTAEPGVILDRYADATKADCEEWDDAGELEDDGTGGIAEQNDGAAIFRIERARQRVEVRLRTDDGRVRRGEHRPRGVRVGTEAE